MGIGIRIATPLRVGSKRGRQSTGRAGYDARLARAKNEKEVGRNSADGAITVAVEGKHVGMSIFCHPENFRASWFHARDYGLLEANPFGRHAFRKGDVSKVVVKPGETLRLSYGVLLHSEPLSGQPDLARGVSGLS